MEEAPLLKVNPKTARGKRVLNDRLPKAIENVKNALFVKGTTISPFVQAAMHDLYALKKPDAILFSKRNQIHPFDGGANETTLEFYSEKNDSSLIVVGTHSKKRPHNLSLVRMFDGHILDLVELGIVSMASITDIGGETCGVGMKPSFVFSGELWEQRDEYRLLKNILVDFYRGQVVDEVNLAGLEWVISVAAGTGGLVHFRVYRILLKKSGTKLPRLELELMGPSIDFKIGRFRVADETLWKNALKMPKELKPSKTKNVDTTVLGESLGRVHMAKQNLDSLQTRKMKGLKKSKIEKNSSE